MYRTDFHDFFHQMERICVNVINPDQFSDLLRDVVAIATNFGQNWRNDLHSAPWHFKTDWNIAIWISSLFGGIAFPSMIRRNQNH